MMTKEQQLFLDAQMFSLTLMGTVQRNRHLYVEEAKEAQKLVFRKELRKELQSLVQLYADDTTAKDLHLANVVGLANHISAICPSVLKQGRFKIGAAQKALNLYLKYMWCIGRIQMPPHCPFDSIVLSEIGCGNDRWTEVDDIGQYNYWVDAAHKTANGAYIAMWELEKFNTPYRS